MITQKPAEDQTKKLSTKTKTKKNNSHMNINTPNMEITKFHNPGHQLRLLTITNASFICYKALSGLAHHGQLTTDHQTHLEISQLS